MISNIPDVEIYSFNLVSPNWIRRSALVFGVEKNDRLKLWMGNQVKRDLPWRLGGNIPF